MAKQPLKPGEAERSPEMALLLLCCINEPSEAEQKQIQRLIQNRPDWNMFYKLTMRHRVYPVVYRNLKKADCAEIDSVLISTLAKENERNTIKSLQYAAELVRLTELFRKSAVRAVSIKGPILSREIGGDIAMRMSKDLDLLVCPAEIEKAEQILLGEGYIRTGKLTCLSAKQRATLLKTGHHFSYINRKNGVNIELHWRAFYESYNFDFEEMWAEKAVADLHGNAIAVLNPEEDFLYLVFHGSTHAWFRLKWLCDIAELVKKGGLDWNHIGERVNVLGIAHLLCQALLLANRLFGTDAHNELFDIKTSRSASRLAKLALAFILSVDYNPANPTPRFSLLWKEYMVMWNRGFARKLAFVRLLFYPVETDFEQMKLPDRYFAVYFLARPVLALQRKWHAAGMRNEKA